MTRRFLYTMGCAAALLAAGCGGGRKTTGGGLQPGEQRRALSRRAESPDGEAVRRRPGRPAGISDAQQDNSRQVAQVETFIRQKPALLIVAPNERAALTAVMGQAMDAGIPVICLERDILQPNYTHLHPQRQRGHRPAGGPVHRRPACTKSTARPRATWWPFAACWAWRARSTATAARREILEPLSRNSHRGRPGGRLDPGQSQGPHDRGAARPAAHRRGLRPQRPHGVGAYLAAKELGREQGNDLRRRGRPRRSGGRHS